MHELYQFAYNLNIYLGKLTILVLQRYGYAGLISGNVDFALDAQWF